MKKYFIIYFVIHLLPILLLGQTGKKDTTGVSNTTNQRTQSTTLKKTNSSAPSKNGTTHDGFNSKKGDTTSKKIDYGDKNFDTLKYSPDSSRLYLYLSINKKNYVDSIITSSNVDTFFINLDRIINVKNNRARLEKIKTEILPPTPTYRLRVAP